MRTDSFPSSARTGLCFQQTYLQNNRRHIFLEVPLPSGGSVPHVMRSTRVILVDSFLSARGELRHLFSSRRAVEHVRRDVRRYVLTRSRHMQALSISQQRSWIRANLSLVLQEARREQNALVAEAALSIALQEKEWVDDVDPAWVKDALASCRHSAELRQMQACLETYAPAYLAASGGSAGSLMSIMLGGAGRGAVENAARLGNDAALATIADDDQLTSSCGEVAAADDSVEPETVVAAALSQAVPVAAGSPSLVPPTQRALTALHKLRRTRDENTVAPNQSFSRYFLRQGLVKSESELLALYQAMRARPEEVGFRVHLSHPMGPATAQLLAGREGILPVSWLPAHAGAYVLDARQAESIGQNRPLLKALATEGLVSFQSTSSMLPAHYLNPQPGELVLDLCAAPGSKTRALVDYMAAAAGSGGGPSRGCVVANEFHHGRVSDLQRRLQNVSPEVAVTHMAGESFGGVGSEDLFDKVLVDAPCSGEGRLRREPMAWRLWHPCKALEFFPRQVRLLQRAVEVCKPGGTIVYATCTLNPLENEAVVSAVWQHFEGRVELAILPPLPTRHAEGDTPFGSHNVLLSRPLTLTPGLQHWVVPSPAGGFYETPEEAAAAADSDSCSLRPRAVFPPTRGDPTGAHPRRLQEACRRVLPHVNARGSEGFFVAVLRKVAPGTGTQTASPARRALGSSAQGISPTGSVHAPAMWSGRCEVADSILHDSGLARLPATSERVVRYLRPFFSTDSALSEFMAFCQLAALWREGEGLRLASIRTTELVRSVPSRTPQRSALRNIGVVCINGRGDLTESGAVMLYPHAAARILQLPTHYLQVLLASRHLDITRDMTDAVAEAHRVASNGLARQSKEVGGSGMAWAAALVDHVQASGGSGNAIVVGNAEGDQAGGDCSAWQRVVGTWPIPVRVDISSSDNGSAPGAVVRLHLLLSAEARHRYTAMLGRLQGQQRRAATRTNVVVSLLESAENETARTMGANRLTGGESAPGQKERALFGSNSRVWLESAAAAPPHRDVFEL